jgi:hypothetical protein
VAALLNKGINLRLQLRMQFASGFGGLHESRSVRE